MPWRTRPARSRLAVLAALVAAVACVPYPQRLPGPLLLPAEAEAAPPAVTNPSQAASVQRDSDPVWVRRPLERGEYALPFYKKRERLVVGSMVRTGAGGRAELLWAPDATSLVLFDEGRVTLGDPERDEPLVRFHSLTHALLVLTPEDRIELLGGARLRGDPAETTGPILLEHTYEELLRVTNQSKRLAEIRFRDASLELAPGESIDLPLLQQGSAPSDPMPDPERFGAGALTLVCRGAVERGADSDALRLTATEPALVTGLGVQTRLASGEGARFSGLSQVPPAPPTDPTTDPNSKP